MSSARVKGARHFFYTTSGMPSTGDCMESLRSRPEPKGLWPEPREACLVMPSLPNNRDGSKSFPCKSKSSHKSFGQTSSQVKSQVI